MRRRLIVNNKVILKKKGYKAYLILNKPEKLNALDMDMYLDLLHYMKELEKLLTYRLTVRDEMSISLAMSSAVSGDCVLLRCCISLICVFVSI